MRVSTRSVRNLRDGTVLLGAAVTGSAAFFTNGVAAYVSGATAALMVVTVVAARIFENRQRPRSLSKRQIEAFAETLSSQPKGIVTIRNAASDSADAQDFYFDLKAALRRAGFNVGGSAVPNDEAVEVVGIRIDVHQHVADPAATLISEFLNEAGIACAIRHGHDPGGTLFTVVVGKKASD